ncbi:MAG TPA: helix-turn-helix domain-containing protein [Solirubrobacteraceae bacterium]|nr:helix-turn-helix domain-containing protein [Solirubrobacteraceae bacterium]
MQASQPGSGRQALQQRVATAILEAAATVLAAQGERGSMTDVAEAAGVARATVYRYFPNRQSLLDELAEHAIRSAGERLASARIEHVPVADGVTRAVRALVDVGDLIVVLARERLRPAPGELERHVSGPLRRLLERGQEIGEIRGDIPSTWLADALVATVASVLSSSPTLGREDTVAAIAGLFADGARADDRSAA